MTTPDQESDRNQVLIQYLTLTALGDNQAFGHLYDETSPLVYGIAMRMLKNAADAEDLVIEVYTQAWRSAATYDRSRGPVVSWLVTIVRSRAIDKIRSRRSWVNQEELRLHLVKEPSKSFSHPAVELERKQTRGIIRRAVDSLPAAVQTVIQLCYFNGLSHSEIAENLGEPLGTVKSRIRQGLQIMRTNGLAV